MTHKLYAIAIAFGIGFGWLLYGCSSQPGAAPVGENLQVVNLDADKMSTPSSTVAKNVPADASYPPPANQNPHGNLSYPQPGLSDTPPSTNNPGNPPEGEPTPSLSMQLALGTLLLESTENTVTPEQAVNLLPLWQEVYNLSTADDVPSEDLEAAFEKIQEALTEEQLEAIQSMEITREGIAALADELGIDLPMGPFPTLSAEQQATMQASGQSGMPPTGATPGAGGPGGRPGGMGTPPPGAAQFPPGGGNPPFGPGGPGGFEVAFYQAIIDLMETKIQ